MMKIYNHALNKEILMFIKFSCTGKSIHVSPSKEDFTSRKGGNQWNLRTHQTGTARKEKYHRGKTESGYIHIACQWDNKNII